MYNGNKNCLELLNVDMKINLNVEVLNKRIRILNYCISDIKNKPLSNFKKLMLIYMNDHTNTRKAAQIWCLINFAIFSL